MSKLTRKQKLDLFTKKELKLIDELIGAVSYLDTDRSTVEKAIKYKLLAKKPFQSEVKVDLDEQKKFFSKMNRNKQPIAAHVEEDVGEVLTSESESDDGLTPKERRTRREALLLDAKKSKNAKRWGIRNKSRERDLKMKSIRYEREEDFERFEFGTKFNDLLKKKKKKVYVRTHKKSVPEQERAERKKKNEELQKMNKKKREAKKERRNARKLVPETEAGEYYGRGFTMGSNGVEEFSPGLQQRMTTMFGKLSMPGIDFINDPLFEVTSHILIYLYRNLHVIHKFDNFYERVANIMMNSYSFFSAVEEWTGLSNKSNVSQAVLCGVTFSFVESVSRVRSQFVETEALSDEIDTMRGFLDMTLNCDLYQSLTKLVLSVCSLKLFSKDFAHQIYAHLGTPIKGTVTDLVSNVLSALSKLCRLGEDIYSGVPVWDVLFSKDPVRTALVKADDLLRYQDLLYTGLPSPGRKCMKQFYAEATSLSEYITSVKKNTNPLSSLGSDLSSRLAQLELARSNISARISSTTRAAPIGVVLHGQPGVGKSNLLKFIAGIHSKVKGRVFDKSQIYPRVTSSEYWEGYLPFSHPYVHYSEVGSKTQHVLSGGDPTISELTSVIDSMNYICNMARAEDKGKVPFLGEMVLIDTNCPEMNLSFLQNNASAFRRRFVYITPTVKPEYRKSGSNALDPTKCNDGSRFFDKWEFVVYLQNPVSVSKSISQSLHPGKECVDIDEMTNLLADYFEEQIRHEEAVSQAYDDANIVDGYGDFKEVESESLDLGRWGDYGMKKVKNYYQAASWFSSKACNLTSFLCVAALFSVLEMLPKGKSKDILMFSQERLTAICFFFILAFYFDIGISTFFLLSIFTLVDWQHLSESAGKNNMKRIRDEAILGAKFEWASLSSYCGFDVKGYLPNMTARTYNLSLKFAAISALVVGGAAASYAFWKWFQSLFPSTEVSSDFVFDSVYNSPLQDEEAKFECGNGYTRVSNSINVDQWNIKVPLNPPSHTSEPSGLMARIGKNVRRCVIVSPGRSQTTYVTGIYGNIAILNTHALPKDVKNVSIDIFRVPGQSNGGFISSKISEETVCHLGNDITAVMLSGINFADIRKHVYPDEVRNKYCTGYIGTSKVAVEHCEGSFTIRDKYLGSIQIEGAYRYDWNDHSKGKCGLPLLVTHGKGWCIAGVHTGGITGRSNSYATQFNSSDIARICFDTPLLDLQSESADYCVFKESVNRKSAFRHEHLPGIRFFGSLDMKVAFNNDSSLQPTVFSKELLSKMWDVYEFMPSERYCPPHMKPFKKNGVYLNPYNLALKKMSKERKSLDKKILGIVVERLVDRISEGLGDIKLTPLTIESAINGVKDDPFIKRINASTGGGFGWPGTKNTYIPLVDTESTTREPVCDLKVAILDAMGRYTEGRSNRFIFAAQLKDEPRTIEKVEAGKTRVFYASEMVGLTLQRMFLAPFYSLMVEKRSLFCVALGINMHSEAADFYSSLKNFSSNIIEGDYSGFDQGMPFDIGWAVSSIVYKILEKKGYNAGALVIVRGLLTDNMFPYVEMLGDLILVPALQPSGKYATAEDNSLRGLVMLMYYWYSVEDLADKDFFEFVLPMIYGDDVLASVKESVSDFFNNQTYQKYCEECLGMGFTTASKTDVMEKFVDPDSMSFLKRTFRKHPVYGDIVATLDMNSIFKLLSWVIPSSAVNIETQMVSMATSALWELFFWSTSDQHEVMRTFLISTLHESYQIPCASLEDDLPSFLELGARLGFVPETESRCLQFLTRGRGRWSHVYDPFEIAWLSLNLKNAEHADRVYRCFRDEQVEKESNTWKGFGRSDISIKGPAEKLLKSICALESRLVVERERLSTKFSPMGMCQGSEVRSMQLYAEDDSFKQACDEYYGILANIESLEHTIALLEKNVGKYPETESADGLASMGAVDSSVMETHETVRDVGGMSSVYRSAGKSFSDPQGQKNLLDIHDFFARPIPIVDLTMDLNTELNYSNNIWETYLLNPSVRAKLRNYAFFRGTLNLRIAVSGMPFHYGKVQFSYQPFAKLNANLMYYDTQLSTVRREAALAYLSQSPGVSVIDVKSNQPVDLVCPFIAPMPMIRLFNDSNVALSASTPYADSTDLGKVYIQSLNVLRSTTTGPSNVSIILYAWMTDVELGAPTATIEVIETESATYDERKTGPIEKVATRAAEISTALVSVPYLAPYAKASSMMFKGMSHIASIMGWSYPVLVDKPSRMKMEPFQNGAQTIGMDTGKRITLDPLQELTVDSRCVGTDRDEMALSHICAVDSLLSTFEWTSADLPRCASIWACLVCPSMSVRNAIDGSSDVIQPTALAYAARPFFFWRGDITYRFEIVCSAYHRGKFAILFEPNIKQSSLIDVELHLNKQYVQIIDIQETQDFEICVNWASARSWLKMPDPLIKTDFSVSSLTFDTYRDYANGYIAVVPLTALQSPDGSSIAINVYTYSDSMYFNELIASRLPLELPGSTESMDITCFELNPSSASVDHIRENHFGEAPTSFRSLLKRFETVYEYERKEDTTTTRKVLDFCLPNVYTPSPTSGAGLATHTDLLSYLRYAYVGIRGGMRYRFTSDLVDNARVLRAIKVSLEEPGTTNTSSVVTNTNTGPLRSTLNGTVTFIPTTNGGVEYEVPWYSNNIFGLSFSTDHTPSTSSLFDPEMCRMHTVRVSINATQGQTSTYLDRATGEDFSLMRFQGAPPNRVVYS